MGNWGFGTRGKRKLEAGMEERPVLALFHSFPPVDDIS